MNELDRIAQHITNDLNPTKVNEAYITVKAKKDIRLYNVELQKAINIAKGTSLAKAGPYSDYHNPEDNSKKYYTLVYIVGDNKYAGQFTVEETEALVESKVNETIIIKDIKGVKVKDIFITKIIKAGTKVIKVQTVADHSDPTDKSSLLIYTADGYMTQCSVEDKNIYLGK